MMMMSNDYDDYGGGENDSNRDFFQNITKMCLLGRPWEYVEWGQLNVSVHFESAATLYRYGV